MSRLKCEVQFNFGEIALRYLESGSNASEVQSSFEVCAAISDDAERLRESQRLFLAASSMSNALLASEIDRIEAVVRAKFPELRYIDIEPM